MNNEPLIRKSLIRLLTDISLTILFTALVFTFVFGICIQRGNDMYPSIRDGDVILYYRHPSLIQTEAVVYESGGLLRTGRIAAVSGTVISETNDHQITLNGIFLPEDPETGIYSKTFKAPDQELPATVSEGCYFILNDDRSRMSDSRSLGEIGRRQIKGRIITVLRRRNI